MVKQSAGLLMYRCRKGSAEVLLVHPGGPYWSGKDSNAWTIPKGEIEKGEDALTAARREFEEETGFRPDGDFRPLNPVRLRSRKTVYAWAFEGDCDPHAVKSMTFTMEWPPHSGKEQEFPEVDKAEWFNLEAAKEKIQSGQMGFIEEFARIISEG
ncbi:MAG: NUDIX domain-containing protein [Syntrophorhabdales bacterium]|jgi:predicted NUDIX family NTP pyrophosphohydrolase